MAALHLASWVWKETLQVQQSGFEVSVVLSHMWQVLEPGDTCVFWQPLALDLLWF